MRTTNFEEFMSTIDDVELNTQEWVNLCEIVVAGEPSDIPPFKMSPSSNNQNMILEYTPTNAELILTPSALNYFITWVERKYMNGEPYFAYLAVKEAMKKDD